MATRNEHTLPTASPDAGPYVVRVSGDMDVDHAEQLTAALTVALSRAPRGADLVVDLCHSSFCDSAGLNVLLAARQRACTEGKHLVLAAPSHQMIRLLELTGAEDLFAFAPAVAW
ncbi:STAS domain-containing protein [Streptomyces sp. WAC06614]|uniref:STAS domain-containing protein n=1 Tax=Streptomyces sp. WAC06614 TaxID=2487416 RepID=UPI000F765DEE|nr:STAS domain-containing protein [Streptomyces sp. WAC06614]RSS58113.1 anti-sigma factor antagonist [Streptomyces sp. WAC06614]